VIGRIGVDPEQVLRTRARMADLADEIGEARHRLEVALAGEGRCWGTDEAGVAFEAAYLGPSHATRSMLATAEVVCRELATAFGRLATALASAERDAGRVVT
jgi:hypothetical protein